MTSTLESGHPTRTLDWRAAIWAGIAAGIAFLVLEMLLVQVLGPGSMWGPPRMMAAIVMGEGVLPPPATFDLGIFIVALIVHFVLSLVYAFMLAWGVSRWGLALPPAIGVGIVFGLLIYVINFYGFTAIFPWFAEARGWIGILAHVIFGLVLGAVYRLLAPPQGAAA